MKDKIQKLGKILSGMVLPNTAAFIAWGFITSLFSTNGWFPNETLSKIITPMLNYLLPSLIAYSGGKMFYQERGAIVAVVATFGLLVGSDITMFIGAMIMAPIAALTIKKFDELVMDKVPTSTKALVSNFSAGIIGTILAIIGCLVIGPVCISLNNVLQSGVNFFVNKGILPLLSIFVEPAKVLFLNSAINHGILAPIGINQVLEKGKSLFFLIEGNPGPGLGLLLAYCIFGKGKAKHEAPGAILIHFIGGIHEIYFPYVLMNPLTIIAMILGGSTGVLINVIFDSGLVAPASPGSIISIIAMCERHSYVGVLLSVFLSALVTFIVASFILKVFCKEEKEVDLDIAL